ncbi:MAG: hypothetical protein R2778_09880 [Saprospiraceae bacterium]
MSRLGNNLIICISTDFPGGEDPGANFWKWMRRPNFSYDEYLTLKDNLSNASEVGFYQFLGMKTARWRSNNVEGVFVLRYQTCCRDLFHLEFDGEGRYFSPIEYQNGKSYAF